jgi:hypothetical protein
VDSGNRFGAERYRGNELVSIEDYIVGAPYEVIEVDGVPPERANAGLLVTVVPLVLVKEVTHRLSLVRRKTGLVEQQAPKEFLTVEVKEGRLVPAGY